MNKYAYNVGYILGSIKLAGMPGSGMGGIRTALRVAAKFRKGSQRAAPRAGVKLPGRRVAGPRIGGKLPFRAATPGAAPRQGERPATAAEVKALSKPKATSARPLKPSPRLKVPAGMSRQAYIQQKSKGKIAPSTGKPPAGVTPAGKTFKGVVNPVGK